MVFFWHRSDGSGGRVFRKFLFLVESSSRKIAQNKRVCARNARFLIKNARFLRLHVAGCGRGGFGERRSSRSRLGGQAQNFFYKQSIAMTD